jgi:hypothetical protein
MQYDEDGYLPEAVLNYLARLGWSTATTKCSTWSSSSSGSTSTTSRPRRRSSTPKSSTGSTRTTHPSLLPGAEADARDARPAFDRSGAEGPGGAATALASCAWQAAELGQAVKQTAAESGLKMPQLAIPLRVALLGLPQSPSIDAVLEVHGARARAGAFGRCCRRSGLTSALRSESSRSSFGLTMSRVLLPLFLLFLAGVRTSPEGRSQLVAPAPLQGFSAVYSEFDMHLQLVTAADAPACQEAECVADRAFDQRILALGRRLAVSAFRQHADLYLRFPRFEFVVADKADAGAASSAGGTVMIYRGVQRLNLDDAALAFVLAREMSHIIAGHHDENVTTSVLVAVAAQILFPALNIGATVCRCAPRAAGSAAVTRRR